MFNWNCQTFPAYLAQSKWSSWVSLDCACQPPHCEGLLAQGRHCSFPWNQLSLKGLPQASEPSQRPEQREAQCRDVSCLGRCSGAARRTLLAHARKWFRLDQTEDDSKRSFYRKSSMSRTIKELSCSPLESGVTWSLLLSSSDSSWGLVRDTGDAGGGGNDKLKESPLALASSEMVSHG